MGITELHIYILLGGLILLFAVFASKAMYKYGVPTLIIFLLLGMLMGSEGFGGVDFENYNLTQNIASIALLVIIFSGGFDTNWKSAKNTAMLSITLASLGVVLTAVFVGLFAHLVLDFTILEGLLLGSIISSTDAASVFSILKAKKLNLKNNLASTLEMESGSNDPMAYLLTIVFIGILGSTSNNIALMFIMQIIVGAGIGLLVGKLAVVIINNINLEIEGLYIIIAVGMMLSSYGLASVLYGNGFLAVYLTGLIMGNNSLVHKVSLVRFFDGLTLLMQIVLFFTLGLIVFPSQVLTVVASGLAVALFITFIARPIAILIIMKIFKRPFKDSLLVSWVGFRGAASIVFAIYVFAANINKAQLIFNIVFFVAVFSVLLQGSLLVPLAKKLDLVAKKGTVLKTFTDYSGEIFTDLLEIRVRKNTIADGKMIKDLTIPDNLLIVMIKRGKTIIAPRGTTKIYHNDILMIASETKEELLAIDALLKEKH